jgi:hypothetical protein
LEKNMLRIFAVVLFAVSMLGAATVAHAMGGGGGGGGGAAAAGGGAGGGNWSPVATPTNDGVYNTQTETNAPVSRTRKKAPTE